MTALRIVHLACDGLDGDGCPRGHELDTGFEDVPGGQDFARREFGWSSPLSDVDLCRECSAKYAGAVTS